MFHGEDCVSIGQPGLVLGRRAFRPETVSREGNETVDEVRRSVYWPATRRIQMSSVLSDVFVGAEPVSDDVFGVLAHLQHESTGRGTRQDLLNL